MAKKEKTPTQLKRKYKALHYTCFGGEFLSVFAPFVSIGIINYEKYFIEFDGTRMSIAGFLAVSLMGLATWLVAKKKFTNSYITLIVGWATITVIFFLLGEIINDIAYIMLFGLIGFLGAFGLDIASAQFDKKANEIQSGIDEARKQMTTEAYREELSQKEQKKKIKIKKGE